MNEDANVLTASGNPLLLLKSFNQTGSLAYSQDKVSLIDIKKMVCEATKDCNTQDKKETSLAETLEKRQRLPFNYYKLNQDQSILRVLPYEIVGSPRDPASWLKVPPSNAFIHSLGFMSDAFEDYAGDGWGTTGEPSWLRWAVGKQAEIYFPLSQDKDARITLTTTTHQQNPNQKLSIWVNNTLIGKFPVPVKRYSRITFDVPKHLITTQPAHIVFQFSQWNTLPGQTNQYPLAVAFYGFLYVN